MFVEKIAYCIHAWQATHCWTYSLLSTDLGNQTRPFRNYEKMSKAGLRLTGALTTARFWRPLFHRTEPVIYSCWPV